MSPKVLREVILENFEKLNEPEASNADKPESVRVLRNRKVIISPDTLITKYNSLTFSYFTYTFLNSISIEIYKLSFANYLSFHKEDTNNIYFIQNHSKIRTIILWEKSKITPLKYMKTLVEQQ